MSDQVDFVIQESIDAGDYVVATYLMGTGAGVDIHRAALALAELQSTGTWVALAGETAAIRERHAGRVIAIWEVPDHESGVPRGQDDRDWVIQIAYPTHNVGDQIPLLLATVYGECASAGAVKLLDLQLPPSFVRAFSGPKFGLEGIRERVGAVGSPLLVVIMKPALGLTPQESADVFRQAALGGADMVKDDELLVSHPWSHFVDRVREHERVARSVFEETGNRTLYFVNITDRPDRLIANARRAVEAGASGLMVDYATVGISALAMLAEDSAIDVPVMGHLAFAGAMYTAPRAGVSSHLILGKLPRLAGADLMVYPSPYGSLLFARSKHLRLAGALTAPFHGIRSTVPTPGGGMHAGTATLLLEDLGIDHALAAGGAVHGHPMGVAAGTRALRQAMDAALAGEPLAEAAMAHPELAVALQTWPEHVRADH